MITKNQLKKFRVDFAECVKPLEQEYGIKLSIGGITFSNVGFSCRLKGDLVDENGEEKVDLKEFDMLKSILGLSASLNDTFYSNGKEFTITGLNTRARKNAVELKCNDGKKYKASVEHVNRMIATA